MTLLPLVLPTEAAELLRVDRRTLYTWNKEGKLNPIRLPGRGLRYRKADILKLIGGGVSETEYVLLFPDVRVFIEVAMTDERKYTFLLTDAKGNRHVCDGNDTGYLKLCDAIAGELRCGKEFVYSDAFGIKAAREQIDQIWADATKAAAA
jgi:excisionase family DNA binding protein